MLMTLQTNLAQLTGSRASGPTTCAAPALRPMQVPTLVTSGGDQPRTTLTETIDILRWVDKQGDGPLGGANVDRQLVDELVNALHAWDGNLFFVSNLPPSKQDVCARAPGWALVCGPLLCICLGAVGAALSGDGGRDRRSSPSHSRSGPPQHKLTCSHHI